MANQNSAGVDPKSLSYDEHIEYNEKLYKKLLPVFKRYINVDIMHTHVILDKLLTSEMEKVEKKKEIDGEQAGAAHLLQVLYKKPDWFNCLITVMEDESNKLTDFIPKFLNLKGEVDRDWLEKHPRPTGSCLPEGRPCTNRIFSPSAIRQSNFDLKVSDGKVDEDWLKKHRRPTRSRFPEGRSCTDGIFYHSAIPQRDFDLKGADGYGMHRDGDCEDSTGSTVTAAGSCKQVPLLSRDADIYVGASVIKTKSASSTPGGERQNHPGLKDALSFKPVKDFERDFVRNELGAFQAFSSDEEEHQIIERLQPYLHKAGTYVIWYWSLAKRPTICVVAEQGRILTFVVHRSFKNPPLFYISKEHETSSSLKGIVQFHIDNSILYIRKKKFATVHLKTPVQRYTQRK